MACNFVLTEQEKECIPNWECSYWSECKVDYDIDGIISGTSSFEKPNEQERICIDINGCEPNKIQKRECGKVPIELKKEEWCFIEHTVVLDNGKEVARIRPVLKQGIPRVDIDVGELMSLAEQEFCWYCGDGIQNYDETGVDCGGSCPECEITIKIKKEIVLLKYPDKGLFLTFPLNKKEKISDNRLMFHHLLGHLIKQQYLFLFLLIPKFDSGQPH